MSLVSVGQEIYWPALVGSGYASSGLSTGNITFDSATDRLALVAVAPYRLFGDTVASLTFRTGTVTTGNTMEVRIETVSNGRPSGTLWATNTNGTVVIADNDDGVWKTVTFTAAADIEPGQLFAIVFINSSGTPNLNLSYLIGTSGGYVDTSMYPLFLQDTGGGTWASPASGNQSVLPWVLGLTTAGSCYLSGTLPQPGSATTTAFNSGSSPDEYALKFTIPFKCRCIGAKVWIANIAAGGDFSISLWPSSSTVDGDALAQRSMDGDFPYATTTDGYVTVYWTTPVTLNANTVCYLGARADTANSLAVAQLVASSSTNIKAFNIPTDATMGVDSRTWTAGSAGAWTGISTTTIMLASLIIDQMDNGAAAGGGIRIAGHGGLAA